MHARRRSDQLCHVTDSYPPSPGIRIANSAPGRGGRSHTWNMANTRVMDLSGILPGEPGNGEPYGAPPGGGQPGKPRRGRVLAIAVACAVVAGGGAFAVADALSSPSAPPAAVAGAPSPASAPAGQAAVLSGLLNDTAADGTGASPGAVSMPWAARPHGRAALRRERRALARLRLLGGMHGEFTFRTKSGPRTLAFERGTVTSVASAAITVRAADGTTWTWQLTSSSVVRGDGMRAGRAALAAGQRVFVAGPVPGSARDARLIVIGDRSGGDS